MPGHAPSLSARPPAADMQKWLCMKVNVLINPTRPSFIHAWAARPDQPSPVQARPASDVCICSSSPASAPGVCICSRSPASALRTALPRPRLAAHLTAAEAMPKRGGPGHHCASSTRISRLLQSDSILHIARPNALRTQSQSFCLDLFIRPRFSVPLRSARTTDHILQDWALPREHRPD